MPRMLLMVVLLIVLCLGASVGYFNAQQVEFSYLAGTIKLPLISLVLAMFLTGAAFTLLIAMTRILRLKADVRRLRRQIRDQEVELKNLRNLQNPSTPIEPQRG